MRWILLLGVIVGGLAAAAWSQRDQLQNVFSSAPDTKLKTKPVAEAPRDDEAIHALGFVEGTTQAAELRFEIPGRLDKIPVKEGQTVRAGDVLAELDSVLLNQQVTQAEAELVMAKAEFARLQNAARPETRQVAKTQVQVAQAELNYLQDEADRVKRLFEKGAVTDKEWKNAFHPAQIAKAKLLEKQALAAEVEAPAREDDLAVAQSKIDVAQEALIHAKLQLDKARLLAPTDGTILHLDGEIGELVEPTDEKPLLLFSNLETIRVRAYVEELNALRIAAGDRAEISADGLTGRTFSGTVVYCAAWMDEKQHRTHKPNELLDVRTREVVIEVEDVEELLVGLPVDVMIRSQAKSPFGKVSEHQTAKREDQRRPKPTGEDAEEESDAPAPEIPSSPSEPNLIKPDHPVGRS